MPKLIGVCISVVVPFIDTSIHHFIRLFEISHNGNKYSIPYYNYTIHYTICQRERTKKVINCVLVYNRRVTVHKKIAEARRPVLQLSCENKSTKERATAMNTVTQITGRRQAIIQWAEKHGVTSASRRHNVSLQLIYRWKKRYDGTLESLQDRTHRPHSHPNQHTEEELRLIRNMRRRNPHLGLVVFWFKLRPRLYTLHHRSLECASQAESSACKAAESRVHPQAL